MAYLALAGCSFIYAAFILVLGGLPVAARGFLLSAAPKRSASARVRFCLSSFSFLFFGSQLAAGQAVAGWLLGLPDGRRSVAWYEIALECIIECFLRLVCADPCIVAERKGWCAVEVSGKLQTSRISDRGRLRRLIALASVLCGVQKGVVSGGQSWRAERGVQALRRVELSCWCKRKGVRWGTGCGVMWGV